MRLPDYDRPEAKLDNARSTALPFATSQYPGAGLRPCRTPGTFCHQPHRFCLLARRCWTLLPASCFRLSLGHDGAYFHRTVLAQNLIGEHDIANKLE